jgi:2-amino-4-hydroxy-6-hydroxymethyldihydropteridine diphosphokinase
MQIEARLGRVRDVHWGPRTLDLDLIVAGDLVIDTAELQLPHPRAHLRAFVLEPWLSIDPEGEIPGHGRIDELLVGLVSGE